MLASSATDGKPRTPREWSDEFGLTAVINAGVLEADWLTVSAFLRSGDHLNSGTLTADNSVLVAGPRPRAQRPAFALLDRDCDALEQELPHYSHAVQSIRMLSCSGENVSAQQPKKWSHGVTGLDSEGRLLLIHARSQRSTHDFIEVLRTLPLGLVRLK